MSCIAGFDFGTSNCAVGIMQQGSAKLVNLPQHGNYMPSTLFAPQSDMICGWLYQQLKKTGNEQAYQQARQAQLRSSLHSLKEAKLDGYGEDLEFGRKALEEYLYDPSDCYYVRSPKSFLGASGIKQRQLQQFEDIATAMMWHIKQQVSQSEQQDMEKVVIGRPVNFQGLNSEQSNKQAIDILSNAAKFVGFKQLEFLYEPMAAGLAYQQQLNKEQKVLVVDIGGGTSDVSLVIMGPNYLDKQDHNQLVLGYSGERIGGNDFDINLNYELLMPELGAKLRLNSGKDMPIKPFWDAAAINDFPAQGRFYSRDTLLQLQALNKLTEGKHLTRLIKLQQQRLSYQLSASAEHSKIQLSDHSHYNLDLSYIEAGLVHSLSQADYQQSCDKLLQKIAALIDQVLLQAQSSADCIFVTGGSANAPLVRDFIQQRYKLPLVTGDNFGSVTQGLTLWANKVFN